MHIWIKHIMWTVYVMSVYVCVYIYIYIRMKYNIYTVNSRHAVSKPSIRANLPPEDWVFRMWALSSRFSNCVRCISDAFLTDSGQSRITGNGSFFPTRDNGMPCFEAGLIFTSWEEPCQDRGWRSMEFHFCAPCGTQPLDGSDHVLHDDNDLSGSYEFDLGSDPWLQWRSWGKSHHGNILPLDFRSAPKWDSLILWIKNHPRSSTTGSVLLGWKIWTGLPCFSGGAPWFSRGCSLRKNGSMPEFNSILPIFNMDNCRISAKSWIVDDSC